MAGLASSLLVAGCSSSAPPDIEVASVGRATVTEVVQAPATVVARATASIVAPASGTVASVRVSDGASVQAGQVLVTIASPAATAALAQARNADQQASSASPGAASVSVSGLAQADAAAALAFRNAKAAATLIPDPALRAQALAQLAGAQAQYAAARSSARAALAQLGSGLAALQRAAASLADAQRAQTRAGLAAAEASVASLTVRAPISGTVVFGGAGTGGSSSGAGASALSQLPSSLQGQAQSLQGSAGTGSTASVSGALAPGTPVTAGASLLTVTDVSSLSLAAQVDETDILLVRPGVQAQVNFDAVPDASYPAVVTSVDLAPTTSTRGGVSYLVRLALAAGTNADGSAAPAPRPGMSAVASLDVLTATDVVSVPAAAVFRDATGSGNSVWLVVAGRATRRSVTLGAQGDTVIEVRSGVSVGDRIVVQGADLVVQGQQVGSQ